MKVALVLLVALGVACARPQKKSEYIKGAIDMANDEEMLKEYLNNKTPQEVRMDVNKLNEDINKVLEFLAEAQKTKMFVMENGEMESTPEAEQMGGEMEKFMKQLEFDMEKLPPFPQQGEEVFIDVCTKRAKDYDFNQATDLADLANKFLDHVFECAVDGVEILEELSDLSEVADADLTPENILPAMEIVEKTVNELSHLVAFAVRKFKQGEEASKNGGIGDYNDFIKNDMKKRTFLDMLKERRMAKLMATLNNLVN